MGIWGISPLYFFGLPVYHGMSAQTHGFRPLSQHIPILPASARGAAEGLGGGFVKLRMPMDCKIASTPRSLKSAKIYIYIYLFICKYNYRNNNNS